MSCCSYTRRDSAVLLAGILVGRLIRPVLFTVLFNNIGSVRWLGSRCDRRELRSARLAEPRHAQELQAEAERTSEGGYLEFLRASVRWESPGRWCCGLLSGKVGGRVEPTRWRVFQVTNQHERVLGFRT